MTAGSPIFRSVEEDYNNPLLGASLFFISPVNKQHVQVSLDKSRVDGTISNENGEAAKS